MLKEGIIYALNHLESDPSFSYSKFDLDNDGNLDGLGVLTSGYGAEFAGTDCDGAQNNYRIWSHKGSGLNWSSEERHGSDPINVNRYYVSSALRGKCGSDIVRMGVICHELGHYLGLPDLYDPNFVGVGIGAFDFMSQSWGFDGTGKYPPFLSAWSKARVGWANVVNITNDGTYDIEASWKSNVVYKLSAGYPEGEYLLIENRQPHSYDEKLPGGVGGLAIWHVDEKAKLQHNPGFPEMEETRTGFFPENSYHYQVALLAADGNYDLEVGANQGDDGDLWSATSNRTDLTPGPNVFPNTDCYQGGFIEPTGIKIFNLSASGEKMTFSVEGVKTNSETDESADEGIVDINPVFSQAATSTPKPTSNAPTTSAPSSSKPTSNAPTTSAPTSKPSSSKPTSIQTMPPTSLPTTLRPTSSPTSESALCADRCLTPIDESECPPYRELMSLSKCSSIDVPVGSQCEADGECGTDEYLNNCAGYDVYRRVDCATLEMTSNVDIGDMTNWFTSVTLDNDPIEDAPSGTTMKTTSPTPQPTNEAVIITGSGNIDSSTTSSNGEDCPYYPGIGHSYCLHDCKQPDYMVGSGFFEFHTIHDCCKLHFDDDEKESCISKTLMVMNSEESKVETLPLPYVKGKVWLDRNANNRKGRKEEGVNGILIDMYDCQTKNWVEAQRTQNDGFYKFTELSAGSYYLRINIDDYNLSNHDQRRNGRLDSDFKTSDGTTACFPVQPGGRNIKLDAGLVPKAAQLVSAQQQVNSVSTKQEPLAPAKSYATHSKSSQRAGSLQHYNAPPMLHSKSMLRGSNVAAAGVTDAFIMNMSPVADASIQSNQSIPFAGDDETLRVGPHEDFLLKFDLSSLETHDYKDATSAILRLYAVNASPTGGLVHIASHNAWDEDHAQWTNAPLAGDAIATIGSIRPNEWVEVDVTEAMNLSVNGVFSLRITSENSNHTWLAKFRGISASNTPMLQVTF